jgi:hypothetical protein
MATRKPATAEEIAEVLRTDERIQAGQALPYRDALDIVRWKLHTTPRNALAWLTAATQGESHPYELIGTAYAGTVYHVARGPEVSLTLNEAGYAGVDSNMWPYLSKGGEHISKGDDGASDREFVILPDALRAMCERAERQRRLHYRSMMTARDKEIAGAEEKHGPALAYIRGLMKMIDPDGEQVNRPLHNLKTGKTALTLIFEDTDIERFAEVLAAHDIEPVPPARIITRKPLPEASDD